MRQLCTPPGAKLEDFCAVAPATGEVHPLLMRALRAVSEPVSVEVASSHPVEGVSFPGDFIGWALNGQLL